MTTNIEDLIAKLSPDDQEEYWVRHDVYGVTAILVKHDGTVTLPTPDELKNMFEQKKDK